MMSNLPSVWANSMRGKYWIPVALSAAATAVLGGLGWTHPASLLTAGAIAGLIGILGIARFPAAVFCLVPVSMAGHVYAPLLHYEALVLFLGFTMLLEALPRVDLGRLARPRPLTLAYAIFLLTLLPGLVNAASLWRFGSAVKLYVVGFLGFLVVRRAAAVWGRQTLLWGPVIFVGITTCMLGLRATVLGIPTGQSADLRAYISTLPWGSSNYVAAVTVLCLPAFVYLIRTGSQRVRLLAGLIMGSSLVAMFVTTSRGGFVLSTMYLGSLAVRTRRARLTITALGGAVIFGMVMTPLGQELIGRFSDQRGIDSILFRVWIWIEAWNRGVGAFPFGVGAGQGLVRNDMLGAADPHNFLLHLFGESGVLSVAAWLAVWVILWRIAGRLKATAEAGSAGTVMRDTLVLALLNSMFEPTLVGNLYHLLFWWLLGIYVAGNGAGPPPTPIRTRFNPRVARASAGLPIRTATH